MSKFLKPAEPVIREIRDGDYDDICRLQNAENSPIDKNDPRHPYNEAARLIEVSRDPQSKGRGWLAVLDGRAAGIITTKDFSGSITVDAQCRGRGIAGKLIAAREDFMRAQGEKTAEAHILASNNASIHAFTKAGYTFDKKSAETIAAHGGDRAKVPQNTVLVMTRGLAPQPEAQATRQKPQANTPKL